MLVICRKGFTETHPEGPPLNYNGNYIIILLNPIWIIFPHAGYCHPLAIFRHFCQSCHFAKLPLSKGPSDFVSICAKFAIFAKIAIIVNIASLQGATFGVQFESPALWRFFAIFATACISGHKWSCRVSSILPITRLALEKEPSLPTEFLKYQRNVFRKYYKNSILLNRVAMTGFPTGFCENTPTLLPFL